MNMRTKFMHPLHLFMMAGYMDGTTLLLLLAVAMPLKYWANLPIAVTIVGTIHGWVYVVYLFTILYAQIRLRWHVKWSVLGFLAGFIPLGNYLLNRALKKRENQFTVHPVPKKWLLYAIVLFTFLDLFAQLPVMSTYATGLGASAAMAGFIVGLYSMTNMFGNVISGILTDRYGSYLVLCAGLLLTSGVLIMYNPVDNVAGLLVVRFLHGLLGGLIVPAAFTHLANQTRSEKQGSQSAITGSFVGMAAIVGPAYSGILASRTSVPFVFTTIAALGLVLFVMALLGLRDKGERPVNKAGHRGKLALNRGLLQAFAGAFFLMFSQGALAFLLPLHVESLGYSSRISGTLMSIFGLVAVAIFLLPTNQMFNKIPPVYSTAAGLGLIGLSQMLIGHSSALSALYMVLALYGVGFALLFPSINTLLIRNTTVHNRGQAYGLFYALFSIGTVAGSWGIGLVPSTLKVQFLVTGCVLLACVLAILLTARTSSP